MKKSLWRCCGIFLFLTLSCSGKHNNPAPPPTVTYKPPVVSATFTKGADISWVTQMEASGVKFYDRSGKQQDLFVLMKSLGMNAIRLRAWVDPTDGWSNTDDVVAKALRAKNAGMKVMIDFHYSDSWADPDKQTKPTAWASLDFPALSTTLHDYTINIMTTLKTTNIVPD